MSQTETINPQVSQALKKFRGELKADDSKEIKIEKAKKFVLDTFDTNRDGKLSEEESSVELARQIKSTNPELLSKDDKEILRLLTDAIPTGKLQKPPSPDATRFLTALATLSNAIEDAMGPLYKKITTDSKSLSDGEKDFMQPAMKLLIQVGEITLDKSKLNLDELKKLASQLKDPASKLNIDNAKIQKILDAIKELEKAAPKETTPPLDTTPGASKTSLTASQKIKISNSLLDISSKVSASWKSIKDTKNNDNLADDERTFVRSVTKLQKSIGEYGIDTGKLDLFSEIEKAAKEFTEAGAKIGKEKETKIVNDAIQGLKDKIAEMKGEKKK